LKEDKENVEVKVKNVDKENRNRRINKQIGDNI
jgi:hypothetical protein